MWFLFGEISSSSGYLGWAALFYCGTRWAFHIIILMFSAMLMDAFQDCDAGFPISCRFDGKLFNIRMLQAKSKLQPDVLDKFLNTDDLA